MGRPRPEKFGQNDDEGGAENRPGAWSLPPIIAIVTIENEVTGLNSCIGSK